MTEEARKLGEQLTRPTQIRPPRRLRHQPLLPARDAEPHGRRRPRLLRHQRRRRAQHPARLLRRQLRRRLPETTVHRARRLGDVELRRRLLLAKPGWLLLVWRRAEARRLRGETARGRVREGRAGLRAVDELLLVLRHGRRRLAVVVLLRGLAELALRLEGHAGGLGLEGGIVLLHGLHAGLLRLLGVAVGLREALLLLLLAGEAALVEAGLLGVLLSAVAGLLGLIVACQLRLQGRWAEAALLRLEAWR